MLPTVALDTTQIVIVLSLIAGVMVFFEYNGSCPSMLEFRFAPPYNRLKFGFIAVAVLVLSMVFRGYSDPGSWSVLFANLGAAIGRALDFPYSPVRLVLTLMPLDADPHSIEIVRMSTGVCYALSLVMLFTFVAVVRLMGWPVRRGAFNVWINLPLFDPTGGGDVVRRLNRDSSVNITLGFLLPFLLPLGAMFVSDYFDFQAVLNPQTLIWMTCVWAFVPASMIMRGVAMNRIAELITAKRRRAYAKARTEDGMQTA